MPIARRKIKRGDRAARYFRELTTGQGDWRAEQNPIHFLGNYSAPGLCPVSSVRNSQPVSPLTPVGAPAHGLPLLTGLCAANRSPDGSLAQPPPKTYSSQ